MTQGSEQSQIEPDSETDYLDSPVHMFRPSTSFMRDHLKTIWGLFAIWLVVTFGPVTATWVATDTMTNIYVLEFQLHYFLTAIGSPVGALVLCGVYAWRRDQLDAKYNVAHSSETEDTTTQSAVTDGGDQL
ncbi:DUF4212 domain-containing protein [Salinarchaeum sp. IM2453]|uniref:DUF4212 domain-containing protein n=1 Tax=Salinarchaeum sp. IM2453 TaxID=2862870 RepID=UPI001C82BBE5|nr:DUF4212 domain-containing protein [Salinarchaeum sp. IM2453]QZA88056.1 DUF4212 domain-containing protein [Salinarchaeum sp. IM2453]